MTDPFPGLSAPATTPIGNPDAGEIDRITIAAREVVTEMAGMLEGLPTTAIAVPRSEWTVGEHAAHIAFANIGFGLYAMGLEYPHGDGTQAGLAEANDVALIGFPERDGPALAGHLTQAVETFIRAVKAGSPDQQCPSPLGTMPLGTLTSYFLIHNLMHGCAISAGLNLDFPFRPHHLSMVWPLLAAKLPGFVNPVAAEGISGCVQAQAGDTFEATLQMQDRLLEVLPVPERTVDCRVEAEPVHLFLVMIKMLTVQEAVDLGQMSVSGPDPRLFAKILNAIDIP